jgi:hypothetical protein
VTAEPSNSSSSSSSNSTATYDVICKRRNATKKSDATHITENMSRLLLIVGKEYPDSNYNDIIKQFVEQVTRVGKLAQNVVDSNNSNTTLNEKDTILQSELGKLDKIIITPIVTALLKKHEVFPGHLRNASRANAGVALSANGHNASRANSMTYMREQAESAQLEGQTEINRSATEPIVAAATTVRNVALQVITEIDNKTGNPHETFSKLQQDMASLRKERERSTPSGNSKAASAPSMAPAMAMPAAPAAFTAPAAPAAFTASAAAGSNKKLHEEEEFERAQLDESNKKAELKVLQDQAAELQRARNHKNTTDRQAAQNLLDAKTADITKKEEELNAATAHKVLMSEAASRARAAKAAAGSSSHGGRRTKRKQTKRKQTKRNRKQTKRNRNRNHTHRKNK